MMTEKCITFLAMRVQVLNPDLSYSHCFGSEGNKPGELNGPHGIASRWNGVCR